MRNLILLVLLGVAISVTANAQTAIYEDGVLSVPEVIVVQDDEANLKRAALQRNAAGNYEVSDVEDLIRADVRSISAEAETPAGSPIIVHIEGHKSLECVKLNPVQVLRDGNTFHLLLTEQPVPPWMTCMAVIGDISLDTTIETEGLEPGTYTIKAHGLTTEVEVMEVVEE